MRWICLMMALVLSGCAAVETRPLGTGVAASGIAYQLPVGKMRLRVVEANGVISVLLDGPLVTGDPDRRLVARLPQSGVADNNVTVTVDGKTNLLTKVEASSTGRLTEILTAATKSIVFLQSSTAESGTTLFAGVYEIDDLDSAAAAANAKLAEYYDQLCGPAVAGRSLLFAAQLKKAGQEAKDEAAATKERLLRCRTMAETGADRATDGRGFIRIRVEPLTPAVDPPVAPGQQNLKADDVAACTRGICYRPYRPRAVTLDVRGAFALSDIFLIPDPDSLIHVSLPSGVTAEQKYLLEFTDGVLTKYQRDGKTELVGIASLPFKIVEAALSAPVDALGLKQKDLEARESYLEAVGSLVEKQKAAREACEKAATAVSCPNTAYKLIGGPVTRDAGKGDGPAGDSDAPAPAPAGQPDGTVPTDEG